MNSCPREFIKLVNRLADAAGDIQRRHFRRPVVLEIKPDGSPVTEVDKESERVVRELIAQSYPDHGIAGEEYPSVREDSEFIWVIDPIDGTKSFLAGIPMFGILIALAHQGHFILGVVDQPILRDRWIGADGYGTMFNGVAVQARRCSSLGEAVLCVAGPDNRTQAHDHEISKIRRDVKWVRYGAECYAYGLIASGFIDLLVDAELDSHDFGPLDPIVRNAGGVVTDWYGNPLTTSSDGKIIAAGDPRLIEQVLLRLRS